MPDLIVHQMTALAGIADLKHFDETFAVTNALRTKGTDHLLAAAEAVGVRRFVVQSYAGWPSGRDGGAPTTEADPLDPSPPKHQSRSLEAIRHLEYGVLNTSGSREPFSATGTSTVRAPSERSSRQVHRAQAADRRATAPASGRGFTSTMLRPRPLRPSSTAVVGSFNVVDDEPAPVSEWLPYLAQSLGAKRPRQRWRLAGAARGRRGRRLDDDPPVRGASNAKAKRELRWEPPLDIWRQGFRDGLVRSRGAGGGGTPRGDLRMDLAPVSRRTHVAEAYADLRPLLFSIAYRMLGSVAEAEDIVQEAFLPLPTRARRGRLRSSRRRRTFGGRRPGWRSTTCALRVPEREAYVGRMAAGAVADRRRCARGGAGDGRDVPTRSRWPLSSCCSSGCRRSSARSSCSTTSSTTATARSPAIVERSRGQLSAARRPRATPHRQRTSPGSRRRARRVSELAGRFLAGGRGRRHCTAWSSCSPPTWSCTATGAARCRRGGSRSSAATDVVAAAARVGPRRGAAWHHACGGWRSTVSPVRCSSTRRVA